MTDHERYKKLPVGVILITKRKYKWKKITADSWVCIGAEEDSWEVGDIYYDHPTDVLSKSDKLIYLDTYIKQINGSI